MVLQTVLISNVIFEPYLKNCMFEAFGTSFLDMQYSFIPYDEMQEQTEVISNAGLVSVCLNFDTLYPNLANNLNSNIISNDEVVQDCILKCRKFYSFVKSYTNAPIVWFGFEDYLNNNKFLYGRTFSYKGIIDQVNLMLLSELANDVYVDFKSLIADIGTRNAYNLKGKYRWNAPYSKELIQMMADEVHKQYMIHCGITKKCLVLDCDNVLWGKVLSEDGIEGIQIANTGLGRQFWDFQCFALNMYYHGVIIAICSKNDEADVLRVFRKHSGMLLKEEHISCFQCNWENKPNNIKKISERLNIGLDSIVFVDDSQFELESVKDLYPDVTTVLYQKDSIYEDLSCFNLQLNEDKQVVRNRTDTYKSNINREELKKSAKSFDEYLCSLHMNLDIHATEAHEFARVAELTQRTNKCTNGYRYTKEQLKEMFAGEDALLCTVCLSDRFSDLGVVGVIGTRNKILELFSLSCRALGRNVENEMVSYIKQCGVNEVYFKNTQKNSDLCELFVENEMNIKCGG